MRSDAPAPRETQTALLLATLVIAVCGLVYELLAGTISSYLLGDSVYQFSLVIGVFMAAMGIGAFLSRHVQGNLASAFVWVQLALGVAGGLSAPVLFYAFSALGNLPVILILVLVVTGTLVGLEVPLIVRLLKEERTLRVNLSNVLTVDYAGALFAALLFPLILVPQLGLIRTSLLFGLLNVGVAGIALYAMPHLLKSHRRPLGVLTVMTAVGLITALFAAEEMERIFEDRLYNGDIILAQTTPYQRIVVTKDGDVTSLFLNGGLQFSSIDEYRYHEALVHPPMTLAERHESVLILGGGDGLALREVLRYRAVKKVTVVDLDPHVTALFKDNDQLAALNGRAFHDSKVKLHHADAGKFIESTNEVYDVIIADLPDPRDVNLSRLYTGVFYAKIAKRLAAGGVFVTQATSPFYAREAFWSIVTTLEGVPSPYRAKQELSVVPYHAYVPTFGLWGFVAASPRHIDWKRAQVAVKTRFLDMQTLERMPQFPPDIGRLDVDPNDIHTHALTRYYDLGWSRWYR
ncbi:MAG: polyamine aminopropyltransferase [Chromatiales bacterium]|jgi:spermidine synthase|nr:polyamine aminopropyltransferase [Chromatiales bacterium]